MAAIAGQPQRRARDFPIGIIPPPSVTAAGSTTANTPNGTGADISGASEPHSPAWEAAAITTGLLFLVALIAGIALNRKLAEKRRARQRRR